MHTLYLDKKFHGHVSVNLCVSVQWDEELFSFLFIVLIIIIIYTKLKAVVGIRPDVIFTGVFTIPRLGSG